MNKFVVSTMLEVMDAPMVTGWIVKLNVPFMCAFAYVNTGHTIFMTCFIGFYSNTWNAMN